MTVIITAKAGSAFAVNTLKTNYGYVMEADNVKTLDLTRTTGTSGILSPSFVFADSVAPTLVSVSATAVTSTNKVKVTFSEPVKGTGLYTINGTQATYNPLTDIDNTANTLTLTTGQSSIVGNTQYTLQIFGETDLNGNVIAQNPASQTFVVTIDTAAPTAKVAVSGDKKVVLTFSKAMDVTTLNTTNIVLLNANGVQVPAGEYTVTDEGDGTHTLFDVVLKVDATTQGYFNSSNVFAFSVILTSNIKDSLGNAMVSTSVPVTFTKNTVAPSVTNAQYIAVNGSYAYTPDGGTSTVANHVFNHGGLALTFNESITAAVGTTFTGTQLTAITDSGYSDNGSLTYTYLGDDVNNSNIKIFGINNVTFAGTNTETVRVNGSVFTDKSIGANTNAAQVLVLDVKNTVSTTLGTDTSAPSIGTITTAAISFAGTTYQAVKVDLGEGISTLNSASVLDPASYRLSGAALGAGAFVTVSQGTGASSCDQAIVYLPAGTIASTGSYYFSVVGVKDGSGNVASAGGPISLNDNVKPTMKTLVFNSDGSLSLGFDENIIGAAASDFTVQINSGTALVAGTAYTVSAGVGADSGKVVISFTTGNGPVAGQTVTVTTKASSAGHDAALNVMADGTALSIVK